MMGGMLRLQTILAALVMALIGQPALAQEVPDAPDSQQWIPIVVAVVLALCVVAVSFMNSKRGHQD